MGLTQKPICCIINYELQKAWCNLVHIKWSFEMVKFKRGDAIGFGSREMDINDLRFGQVIKVTDSEIVCWTDIDGGNDEYSFKQLKSGRWIMRSERGDDPKNRLHLRHLTGKQLTECREHIAKNYADLLLPQAVKRVRVAA